MENELATIPSELIPDILAHKAVQSMSMNHFASSRKASESVSIKWDNIYFSTVIKDKVKSSLFKSVYNERRILKGLSGEISNGELLAIMGPTGCGKSSLLNVLSARVPNGNAPYIHLEGSVYVNGKLRNDEKFRRISAYVQQDDQLYTHLTVFETLILAAHFFLPIDTPMETKQALVDSVINDLSLKKARDTIIGNDKVRGVSGGERRRTSIASQMLTDPLVLFLDEPTSGLDAFQAQSVMESMKLLADLGRLVISVIHQPRSSIYSMFDKLLLLSEGRTMFMGPASEAVEYFRVLGYTCPESFNPSDYFLDIFSPDARTSEFDEETKERIKLFGDSWETLSARYNKGDEEKTSNSINHDEPRSMKDIRAIGDETSWRKTFQNFKLLCWRTWSAQSRDYTTIRIKLITTVFFSLLLSGIYNDLGHNQKSIQNRTGLLFFVVINQGFTTIFSVLNTFPREKLIVNRERSGRAYNTFSYFVAKVFVELPLNVLPSILYSCILYWLVRLNSDGSRFVIFIFVLMLVNFTSVAYGLAVSAISPTVEAANALGTPLLIIGILFGGFYISVGSLPIVADWIPYFSFFRWGFEALAINEYTGLTFTCSDALTNTSCITTGEQELQILNFDEHSTSYGVFGLGMVLLGFLTVTFLILENTKMTYMELGHSGKAYNRIINSKDSTNYQKIGMSQIIESSASTREIVITNDHDHHSGIITIGPATTTTKGSNQDMDNEVAVKHEEVYVEKL